MDGKLLAWARAVKSRRTGALPPLWLFSDAARLMDPRPLITRLPPGLCGVVLRHDQRRLGPDLARLCRARRVKLAIAGDWRLAQRLRAGLHLRAGRDPVFQARVAFRTSSAHSLPELRRARRAGAALVFLSPVFPTRSHPGARGLGLCRWAALARRAGGTAAALGGIDGRRIGALPRRLAVAVGMIGGAAA
uniref:Thiamine phosphate synthase n=1 Tax=Acidicaldus sp. TaxID=1872105 RepID=A0A8J4H7S3_9PROT